MEKIKEEIKMFVNKNFSAPHKKEIKVKAKNYLKLVKENESVIDEDYLVYLENIAKN